MVQSTLPLFVPGRGDSLRLSPLIGGPRRPNRRRRKWLWRIVSFLGGLIVGWIAHGLFVP